MDLQLPFHTAKRFKARVPIINSPLLIGGRGSNHIPQSFERYKWFKGHKKWVDKTFSLTFYS
jgi:hypothetical protein